MNANTTPQQMITARLREMAQVTLSGAHTPYWLALECFKFGLAIGRAERRTEPQETTHEGGSHEPE